MLSLSSLLRTWNLVHTMWKGVYDRLSQAPGAQPLNDLSGRHHLALVIPILCKGEVSVCQCVRWPHWEEMLENCTWSPLDLTLCVFPFDFVLCSLAVINHGQARC